MTKTSIIQLSNSTAAVENMFAGMQVRDCNDCQKKEVITDDVDHDNNHCLRHRPRIFSPAIPLMHRFLWSLQYLRLQLLLLLQPKAA